MNQKILLPLLGFALTVVGCASTAPVAPQSQESGAVTVQPTEEIFYPAEPAYAPEPPRVVVQEPRVVESNQNPALDSLVDQALRFMSERQYARAISTAERGMSIDRYDPRVYLLLAQAHKFSGNLALSRQYAERGLAVSQSDTDTSRALEALK